MIHTYAVRNDSGKLMPPYSRVAADYGRLSSPGNGGRSGTARCMKASGPAALAWRSMCLTTYP